MNTILITGLPAGSTNITNQSITFNQATFYECSGVNSNGVPAFSNGKLYLGVSTGQLPIVIPPSGSYSVGATTNVVGEGNLSSYYVTPQYVGDGIAVIYG